MARSAGAATTVLESVRLLYDAGAKVDLQPGELNKALQAIGVNGFTEGQEPYFAMLGTVLRLLLRHASTDVDTLFALTRDDLAELGRDIDDAKFNEIVERMSDEGPGHK